MVTDLKEIKRLRKRVRLALKIMDEALDAIPYFTDGRNDKIVNKMQNWMDANDQKVPK